MECPICKNTVESFHPNSHIVPEWMYTDCYDKRHKVIEVQLKNEKILKRQKGLRGSFICTACEKKTQIYDHYASLILTERSTNSPEYKKIKRHSYENRDQGELLKYQKWENIEFEKLQKFILVTVLRTHFSGKMQGIRLTARHEDRIRNIYIGNDVADDHSYPILIWKYEEGLLNDHVVLPYLRKSEGHHIFEFSSAGYMFNVFVSNHKKPQYARNLSLKKDGSLWLTDIKFIESRLFRSLHESAVKIGSRI